jgi:hypothetical protein
MTDEQIKTAQRERRIQWERRAQTVMLGILVAGGGYALSWVGGLIVQIPLIAQRMDVIDIKMSATYQAKDAKRDFDLVDGRLADIEKKNDAQEVKIDNLDKRLLLIETTSAIKANRK